MTSVSWLYDSIACRFFTQIRRASAVTSLRKALCPWSHPCSLMHVQRPNRPHRFQFVGVREASVPLPMHLNAIVSGCLERPLERVSRITGELLLRYVDTRLAYAQTVFPQPILA